MEAVSLPPVIKIARVNSNSKCYIVIAQDETKVRCKGEVIRVQGCSAMHTSADKVFLKGKVTITEHELSEELLTQLKEQEVPKPKVPKAPKEPKEPKSKWVTEDRFDRRLRLTKWAEKELIREGKGIAEDGLGNYINGEHALQDAAYDLAMGHYELDRAGVSSSSIIREIAADLIYEGMHKVLKKFEAQGKKTTVEEV
jgi:hypothetical protein